MKGLATISLISLASTALGASPSFHRRAKLASRQTATTSTTSSSLSSTNANGTTDVVGSGGIGATIVGSSIIDGSASSTTTNNGGTTSGNTETGAASSGAGSNGSVGSGNGNVGTGSTSSSSSGSTTTSSQGTASLGTPGTAPNPATSSSSSSTSSSTSSNSTASSDPNLTVLNFALTLENLESQFYQEAISVMTTEVMQQAGLSAFQATAITQQIGQQLIDEQTHVQILQATISSLGGTPFAGCSFDFSSVLTDPVTFLSTARSIEMAGVGAYIGGAGLVTNPAVLAAAATILPIEARHQSALDIFSGGSFTAQAFDIGMSPQQVLALAGGFLQGCQASDLGLTANQPLSVIDGLTQSTLFTTGSILQFQTSAQIQNIQANSLSCQMLVGGATTAIVMPASSCIVPPNINGPVAVFLTSDASPLAGSLATQKAGNVIAGPALIFSDIDNGEVLQQVFTMQNLGLRSLPSANLGFAALNPQSNNQNNAVAPGAMSGLGFNTAFMNQQFGAIPSSVVQGAAQFKMVNGGARNVATGGGVGANVMGWLPANNPSSSSAMKRRFSRERN